MASRIEDRGGQGTVARLLERGSTQSPAAGQRVLLLAPLGRDYAPACQRPGWPSRQASSFFLFFFVVFVFDFFCVRAKKHPLYRLETH